MMYEADLHTAVTVSRRIREVSSFILFMSSYSGYVVLVFYQILTFFILFLKIGICEYICDNIKTVLVISTFEVLVRKTMVSSSGAERRRKDREGT